MPNSIEAEQRQLPDGTVTFLFTDIEGSTRLWEQHPQAMQLALARHDHLLKAGIEAHDGKLIKSTGDGLQAVFIYPHNALKAVLAVQRALVTEPWPEAIGHLRVRMALHTATAELRQGDYYGSAVNRVARLMAAGHGGQILISHAVQELVRDDLPYDVNLLDLGQHRLKDLSRPERIFQLIAPDLPTRFPEINAIKVQPSILPAQPTQFIGRERERADVAALLGRDEVSLITLTGPGGIGKTRLALQVAADVLSTLTDRPIFDEAIVDETIIDGRFPDGAFFVDLVPLDDPELIATTIATVLGVGESGGHDQVESLQEHLKAKSTLLLLDNLEHLLDGVELLSQLLQSAPGLKILATSREALNLREEWLFPLDGLPYPVEATDGNIASFGAVQLFAATAGRLRPDFDLADEGESVIRICQLVGGMPLAIELAAVWTKSLSSRVIADEIQRNVDFLDTRLRNLPARHRSMRATFEYSWQHLSPNEKKAFSRLSVFRGGLNRQTADAIAGTSLVTLTGLVDKSLLRWEADTGRYLFHELLRQFAAERLAADPEEWDRLHAAHSVYFAAYCWQQSNTSFEGRPHEAFEGIEIEAKNIHAAWRWAITKEYTDEIIKSVPALVLYYTNKNQYIRGLSEFEKAVTVLRAVGSEPNSQLAVASTLVEIAWFQIRLGRLLEAETALLESQQIYRQLDMPPARIGQTTDPALALGIIASIRGDYVAVEQLGQQALQTSEEFDHQLNREFSYYLLTRAAVARGKYDLAQQRATKMLTIIQEANDQWLLAYCLLELGNVAFGQDDLATAVRLYQEAYTIREKFDDPEGMAVALNHQGKVALQQKNYEEARNLFQRSFTIYEKIGDRGGLAAAVNGLANVAVGQKRQRTASGHFHNALSVAADIQFVPLILAILAGIGRLFLRAGQGERGQELLQFVNRSPSAEFETRKLALHALTGRYRPDSPSSPGVAVDLTEAPTDLDRLARNVLADLNRLDLSDTSSAPAAGVHQSSDPFPLVDQPLVEPLTRRELEILAHIADGLTNKQIAELLIISAGTVKWYTSQIYSKLNVRSRTQAVARARELNILP